MAVKNVVPWFRRLLKMEPLSEKRGLRLCQLVTLVLGAELIGVACYFSVQEKLELFDAMLMIGAVIGVPLGLPVLLGLWIKRIYWVSYFVILGCALIPSIYFTWDQTVNGNVGTIQDRMIWLYAFGVVGLFLSFPLWKWASRRTKARIDEFFTRMHTPVDFEKEIGQGSDFFQLKMIGVSALCMSGFIFLLLMIPNDGSARLQIAGLGAFMGIVGGGMLWASRRQKARDLKKGLIPAIAGVEGQSEAE